MAFYSSGGTPPTRAGGFNLAYLYASASADVWPENWRTFSLFTRLQTQWRVGFNGRSGLDYSAAYPLISRLSTSPEDWDDLLDDLQTMEIAALEHFESQRPQH